MNTNIMRLLFKGKAMLFWYPASLLLLGYLSFNLYTSLKVSTYNLYLYNQQGELVSFEGNISYDRVNSITGQYITSLPPSKYIEPIY